MSLTEENNDIDVNKDSDIVIDVNRDSDIVMDVNSDNPKGPEETNVEKMETDNKNPFAYLENPVFTSEKYKIEIRGLPKYFSLKDLRKFLNVKLQLNCNKVKPIGKIPGKLAYACFRSEEERDAGLEIIKNSTWKNHKLTAKLSQAMPDPYVKKHLQKVENKDNLDTIEKQTEALFNSISPLHSMPYEEQLALKQKSAKQTLNQLAAALNKNSILKDWLKEQKANNDGLPCKLHPIRSINDFTEKYRNKCEFTIAKNDLTGERTVGFRLGTYASGTLNVVSVDQVKIIPDNMKKAALLFEKLVRECEYEPYSPRTLTGNWKMLTARVGIQTNELMLMVGIDPQELTQDELNIFKNKIKDFFTIGEGISIKVDSLYFHLMPRNVKGNLRPTPELLHGKTHIEEILCGLRFKISPESFFQINTLCAELLIKCVKELADVDKDTTVIDICCGTGTLGLCLANECKQLYGIEIIKQAVEDANVNAEINNVKNSTFFCGKADKILTSVIRRADSDAKVVAIVDPPRAGLHKYAIQMLRSAKNLNRFVYLSCDVKSAFNNFTELGRQQSKTLLGDPFVPLAAIPVDMFPMTNHYELVIIFERLHLDKGVPDEESTKE